MSKESEANKVLDTIENYLNRYKISMIYKIWLGQECLWLKPLMI